MIKFVKQTLHLSKAIRIGTMRTVVRMLQKALEESLILKAVGKNRDSLDIKATGSWQNPGKVTLNLILTNRPERVSEYELQRVV